MPYVASMARSLLAAFCVATVGALFSGAALADAPSGPVILPVQHNQLRSLAGAPAGLQTAVAATLGGFVGRTTATEGQARNRRLSTRFERSGPTVFVLGQDLSFWLSGVGYAGALTAPVKSTPRRLAGGEVVYERGGGVAEWYLSGRSGVEQGFTLQHRPRRAGRGGALTIALATSGSLLPRTVGRAVVFAPRGDRSLQILRYSDLSVTDASGDRVPARLSLVGTTVEIVIDDRSATFPIRVDPLIQQGTKIAPVVADPETNAFFGLTVAVSADGSTALIGGAQQVWVFTNSGGVWTQQGPTLTPSNAIGATGEFDSVALSSDGSTALIGSPHDNVAMVIGPLRVARLGCRRARLTENTSLVEE
jgi:hypothetical protein